MFTIIERFILMLTIKEKSYGSGLLISHVQSRAAQLYHACANVFFFFCTAVYSPVYNNTATHTLTHTAMLSTVNLAAKVAAVTPGASTQKKMCSVLQRINNNIDLRKYWLQAL